MPGYDPCPYCERGQATVEVKLQAGIVRVCRHCEPEAREEHRRWIAQRTQEAVERNRAETARRRAAARLGQRRQRDRLIGRAAS